MTPPEKLLCEMSRQFPNAWKFADSLRADRQGLPPWPAWCMLPMAGFYAAACQDLGVKNLSIAQVPYVPILATAAAWRPTQGIYQFDPEVYSTLSTTAMAGEVPGNFLLRLPEWCVYIETPNLQHFGLDVSGFFAHLVYDVNNSEHELRILLLTKINESPF